MWNEGEHDETGMLRHLKHDYFRQMPFKNVMNTVCIYHSCPRNLVLRTKSANSAEKLSLTQD